MKIKTYADCFVDSRIQEMPSDFRNPLYVPGDISNQSYFINSRDHLINAWYSNVCGYVGLQNTHNIGPLEFFESMDVYD